VLGRVIAAGTIVGLVGTASTVVSSAPAFAGPGKSNPYELFCPGTPIGNVTLNDTVTTGVLQVSGNQVTLTNWQTQTALPNQIVQAASALNPAGLQATANAGVDFTGASPATIAPPTITINQPWPTGGAPMTIMLPAPAASVGPATVTGSTVTASVDSNVKLAITNPPVTLTCHTYANNAQPTGISQTSPPGAPATVQIDTTSASPSAAPAPTPTTAAPATAAASSSTLPQTGPGPGLYVLAVGGLAAISLAGLLFLAGRVQRLSAARAGGRVTTSRRGQT
jgi:hypothetical protein